jgi:hypothetical protein
LNIILIFLIKVVIIILMETIVLLHMNIGDFV